MLSIKELFSSHFDFISVWLVSTLCQFVLIGFWYTCPWLFRYVTIPLIPVFTLFTCIFYIIIYVANVSMTELLSNNITYNPKVKNINMDTNKVLARIVWIFSLLLWSAAKMLELLSKDLLSLSLALSVIGYLLILRVRDTYSKNTTILSGYVSIMYAVSEFYTYTPAILILKLINMWVLLNTIISVDENFFFFIGILTLGLFDIYWIENLGTIICWTLGYNLLALSLIKDWSSYYREIKYYKIKKV